ncbi:IclR family transcriptional regulator [Rathayibacter sp. CAU 1779]
MTETASPGPASEPDADARQGIGSVETAAKVLFVLEAAGGPLTLNQIAQRCGDQPSKIHRYLVSLGRTGLTSQSHATGKYDLGPAMRRLGGEALRRTNDVAIASEYTMRLSELTGQSVNLTVWSDGGPVIVRWDYGAHALSLSARVGATLPLLGSAAGQVFFAYLQRTITEQALAVDLGDRTRADVETLRADVRRLGYGTSVGGVIAGLYSLAAPVFSASDALPLAVTLVFPRENLDAGEIERGRTLLLQTAADITTELGGAADSSSRP